MSSSQGREYQFSELNGLASDLSFEDCLFTASTNVGSSLKARLYSISFFVGIGVSLLPVSGSKIIFIHYFEGERLDSLSSECCDNVGFGGIIWESRSLSFYHFSLIHYFANFWAYLTSSSVCFFSFSFEALFSFLSFFVFEWDLDPSFESPLFFERDQFLCLEFCLSYFSYYFTICQWNFSWALIAS